MPQRLPDAKKPGEPTKWVRNKHINYVWKRGYLKMAAVYEKCTNRFCVG